MRAIFLILCLSGAALAQQPTIDPQVECLRKVITGEGKIVRIVGRDGHIVVVQQLKDHDLVSVCEDGKLTTFKEASTKPIQPVL